MISRKSFPAITIALLITVAAYAQKTMPSSEVMDQDLQEVTITKLHKLYAEHKYTVTQVTRWYLQRIARYDGVYKAVIHVDSTGALAIASAEDADAAKEGKNFKGGVLWGVPMVIKANTSIKGLVTSAGWKGYIIPGHELIAPMDAPIVIKLKAAGAVIIGQTNMPDFAASDTNMSSAGGRTGNAYDWRFSPGGSSGGTVTAVAANYAVLGNGTDTGNSIRMPSATSSLVGVLPTRGLVSIAGIHPLDWSLDNTGPIARNVTDAAIALSVMAGEDSKDFRTKGSASKAQAGPYTKYLTSNALKGKRFGVPAFIIKENGMGLLLKPETRVAFMKSLDGMRAAGATIVFDTTILPTNFQKLVWSIHTEPYLKEGVDGFLKDFGPAEYHSSDEYEKAVGSPLPDYILGTSEHKPGREQRALETDPKADSIYWDRRKDALIVYEEPLDRLRLDGYVYPAIQMAPNDETIEQPDGKPSTGPHSNTGWVNPLGVPAVVVPGGFYPTGLPFGLEISARPWKDGDLLGWAFAYEQATKHRKPPVLVEKK